MVFEEEQRPWVKFPPAQSIAEWTGMQVLPEEIFLAYTLHSPSPCLDQKCSLFENILQIVANVAELI